MYYAIGYLIIFALLFLNKMRFKNNRPIAIAWFIVFLFWPITIFLFLTAIYLASFFITLLFSQILQIFTEEDGELE